MFTIPSNKNTAGHNINNNRDIFEGLDNEFSFLKEENASKPEFNTRRSRYLPSGKRDTSNLNSNAGGGSGIPSATTNQQLKGWNQSTIKIAGGGSGMFGAGPNPSSNNVNSHNNSNTTTNGLGSGKQAGYVPSFGSGKGDRKMYPSTLALKQPAPMVFNTVKDQPRGVPIQNRSDWTSKFA